MGGITTREWLVKPLGNGWYNYQGMVGIITIDWLGRLMMMMVLWQTGQIEYKYRKRNLCMYSTVEGFLYFGSDFLQ